VASTAVLVKFRYFPASNGIVPKQLDSARLDELTASFIGTILTLPYDPKCRVPYTRVYPKVSVMAAWSENCKWHSSLPLGAVVSLREFCRHNPLSCFSTSVFIVVYFVIDSVRKLLETPSYVTFFFRILLPLTGKQNMLGTCT
jgi:hypothetical protein